GSTPPRTAASACTGSRARTAFSATAAWGATVYVPPDRDETEVSDRKLHAQTTATRMAVDRDGCRSISFPCDGEVRDPTSPALLTHVWDLQAASFEAGRCTRTVVWSGSRCRVPPWARVKRATTSSPVGARSSFGVGSS